MVEETIQAVRETEKQAEEILNDAKEKQKEILIDASKNAEAERSDYLSKLTGEAKTAMEAAKEEGQQLQAKAEAEVETEINLLKEMALQKKEEAMDLVIEELI